MRLATLLPLIVLAGCATTSDREPVVRTVTVNKPVAVSCIPAALPTAPEYPDTDTALLDAPDAAERYRLVAAGRLLRNQRLAELESVFNSCREVAR